MNITTPVSILIIFYNAGVFFRDAIECVFAQTYPHWELLLADDGSSDGSSEIAREYAERHPDRVRYIQHPGGVNKGMSATRNLGLEHASFPYLALLDADDLWPATKLEEQVALMEQHPEVALLFGRGLLWHSWSGKPEDKNRDIVNLSEIPADRLVPVPEFLSRWLQNELCQPFTSEVMLRTEIIRKLGGWDASFPGIYEDIIPYAKIFLNHTTYYSSKTWCYYRQHENNSCYTAIRDGEWANGKLSPTKERCLLWIQRYVTDNHLGDPKLANNLQRALDPYQNPVRHKIRQLPLRMAGRLKRVAGRLKETLKH